MADAVQIAYGYLNRRERTVAEVRARLERAVEQDRCRAEEIEPAIEELIELGYLDDARYARLYVEDRRNLDRWGRQRIERALLERGVDRETVAAALTGAGAGAPGGLGSGAGSGSGAQHDELEQAIALLRERFAVPPSEPRERERAFGMLVRRGYESELAGDAIRAWGRR